MISAARLCASERPYAVGLDPRACIVGLDSSTVSTDTLKGR